MCSVLDLVWFLLLTGIFISFLRIMLVLLSYGQTDGDPLLGIATSLTIALFASWQVLIEHCMTILEHVDCLLTGGDKETGDTGSDADVPLELDWRAKGSS